MRHNVIRCPLCNKPLEVLMNGLAHCVNLLRDFKTFEEWHEQSCLLAQHNISLPNLVWLKLNDRIEAALTTTRLEAAREVRGGVWRAAIQIAKEEAFERRLAHTVYERLIEAAANTAEEGAGDADIS